MPTYLPMLKAVFVSPPEEHMAGWLYGGLVSAATLAIIGSEQQTSVSLVLLAVGGTLAAYWLVHVYTRLIADRLADPGISFGTRLVESVLHELPIIRGGVPPLLVFLAASLFGAEIETATVIALWSTLVMLGWIGWLISRRVGATGWRMALEIVSAAAFGLLALLLNSTLH